MSEYDKWENDIIEYIQTSLKTTRGDAQAIMEAQPFLMKQSWGKSMDAKETAIKILKSSNSISESKMSSAEKIRNIKKLVSLVENKTGKKIRFVEDDNVFDSNKKRSNSTPFAKWSDEVDDKIKDIPDDKEANSIIKILQEINSYIEYNEPIIVEKIQNGNLPEKYFSAFTKQLKIKLSKAIQSATSENTSEATIDEDVDMTVDQAVKNPDDLKKLTDKKINVNLVDDDDNQISTNTIVESDKSSTGKFKVLSPDGIPIGIEEYNSPSEAKKDLKKWVQRYKIQGYYSTGNRERIPYDEIINHCSLVPANDDDKNIIESKKLNKIKKLVTLIEKKTGKKIMFVESI